MSYQRLQTPASDPPALPHPYWAIVLAILLVLACVALSAGDAVAMPATQPDSANTSLSFAPSQNSHVELHGTATIGAWTAQSAEVHGQVLLDTDMSAVDSLFDLIQPGGHAAADAPTLTLPMRSPAIINLSVPVMTLRGDSNGMTKDLHNALGAPQHPTIDYCFGQLQTVTIQPNGDSNGLNLHVSGQLTMAGAQRSVAMDVFIYRDSNKHYRARTQSTMLMSDFGVTPPSALFGLIHAQNQVQVIFDLDLVAAPQAQAAAIANTQPQ
jgi:hypothetical protein